MDRFLSEQPGMAKRVAANEHTDANTFGANSQRGKQGPALKIRAARLAGLVEVVTVPDAVESQLLEILPTLSQGIEAQVLVRAKTKVHVLPRVAHVITSVV